MNHSAHESFSLSLSHPLSCYTCRLLDCYRFALDSLLLGRNLRPKGSFTFVPDKEKVKKSENDLSCTILFQVRRKNLQHFYFFIKRNFFFQLISFQYTVKENIFVVNNNNLLSLVDKIFKSNIFQWKF